MKKITTLIATTMLSFGAYSQSMVVSDPTSIAQRLLLASQEMDEMIEQKYKFVEQIELLKKQGEEARKMRQRIENVSNAIRKGREIVGIINEAEELMQLNKEIRNTLLESKTCLTDETIMTYVEMLVDQTTEVTDIVSEARKAVQSNSDLSENSDNSHKMSDAERIARLRQVREDLRSIHDRIASIYLRLNRMAVNNSRQNFIHSLY